MTSRERFIRTLENNHPDRVPFLEEGIREEVLDFWNISRKELHKTIPYDAHTFLTPDIDPLPEPSHWPVNENQLDKFLDHFDATFPGRFGDEWQQQVKEAESMESIRLLRVHRGFFLTMGVGGWQRFDDVITLLLENMDFVHQYLREYGKFAARVTELALSKSKVEAVYFSEPIGGNDAPLISPEIYQKIILNSYQPVLDIINKHGIKHIIFMSYSNIFNLLPILLDAGFNCLWACETNNPEMDYQKIRKKFGPDLKLIGGVDVDLLQKSKSEINTKVKNDVFPLLHDGGYIPIADGRVRKNVVLNKYIFYRKTLFSTIMKAR